MKKIAIAVILSATAVMQSWGADDAMAAKRAAATKLLDLFNMDKTYEQTMQQAMQMPKQLLDSQDLSAEEKAEAMKAMDASMRVTLERFSWERMKGMFVDIYTEVLTLEEINGLIEFYQSPVGRKFIEKQPQLTQATMQRMQAVMQELMPTIQAEVQKALEEVQEDEAP